VITIRAEVARWRGTAANEMITDARREVFEECAEIAEADEPRSLADSSTRMAPRRIAAAIRASAQKGTL